MNKNRTDKYKELLEKVNDRMLSLQNDSIDETCPIGIIDFDKWEWPQGIGLYGMLQYYKNTGNSKYLDYMIQWFEKRIEEGLPPKNVNTMAPMLTLAHVYEITGEQKYLDLCSEWAEWIIREMPRTEEGGLQHIVSGEENAQQLWDDTLFMTVLFLGKMGMLLHNETYKEESFYQFLIHTKYLQDKMTGLWFHGWTFLERNNFANAFWARGNCWITAGIPEYIEMMELEGAKKRYLTDVLKCQVEGLVRTQRKDGMWTTLLDENDSYAETSATAGFGYGILKAVRMGYLDEKYLQNGEKAVAAVMERIGEDGTVMEVSYGTGMGRDLEHYRRIPLCPMAYGQSLAVLLLCEAMKMNAIYRKMWMGRIAEGIESELAESIAEEKMVLEQTAKENGVIAMSIFRHKGLLMFYVESVHKQTEPEKLFSCLLPYLEENIVLGSRSRFLLMHDIYHNNEPVSVEQWKRPEESDGAKCNIACLQPEQLADYIFYHQQLQEERFGVGHKYGMIFMYDNLLAFYKEFPLTPDKPSRQGKLKTNNSPENWDEVMFPHFVLWEGAEMEKQIWMNTERIYTFAI